MTDRRGMTDYVGLRPEYQDAATAAELIRAQQKRASIVIPELYGETWGVRVVYRGSVPNELPDKVRGVGVRGVGVRYRGQSAP